MIKSDHTLVSISYWIFRRIVGLFVKVLLVREVTGLNRIPKTAAILAFNHQSFFDFICFAAVSPRNVHFLSAEKFFDHFWWNILMKMTGQIKVNRHSSDKQELHESVKRHIEKGMLIGIFPEGTRSPHKEDMLKAFNGVAHYALKHKVPVLPVGIKGTYDVLCKHSRHPNLKKVVSIHVGEPVHFSNYHGKHDDNIICADVTKHVMLEISKLSGKRYNF